MLEGEVAIRIHRHEDWQHGKKSSCDLKTRLWGCLIKQPMQNIDSALHTKINQILQIKIKP